LICGDMAVLGDKAKKIHQEMGVYARKKSIRKVLSVGEYARYISDKFGDGGECFSSKTDLIKEFKPSISKDMVILVKGSRSAKMEVVVRSLQAAEES